MQYCKLRNIEGFTLTELMVAMGIGMVVLAAVTTTFMAQAKLYNAQEQINEMEQNARGALDIITRELKMAGYKPNGGKFNGVTYSDSQLMIQADLMVMAGLALVVVRTNKSAMPTTAQISR